MPTVQDTAAEMLLTPGEVAGLFRVDPKTVTRWARAGKLPAIRTLGGHRRYRADDVRALLESGSTVTAAADLELDLDASIDMTDLDAIALDVSGTDVSATDVSGVDVTSTGEGRSAGSGEPAPVTVLVLPEPRVGS